MSKPPEVNLPHDDHMERELIGACLSEDSSVLANVRAVLASEDFFLDKHQRIFQSLCRLADAKEPISVVALMTDLQAHRLQIMPSEIAEFFGNAYPWSVDAHLRRARDYATRRRLIYQAREMGHHAADLSVPLADSTAVAMAALKDAADSGASDGAEDIGGIIEEFGGIVEFLRPRMGIASPWYELNNCTGGWQKGDLILIGARPSMGKTAFMLNAMYGAAAKGTPATIYSYEMSRESLIMRLVSSLTGIPFLDLQQGELNSSERRAVADSIDRLSALPLFIKQFSGKTALAIRVHAEKAKRKGRLGIAAIDYLGLMKTGGRYDSRNQEVGENCRQIKETAVDLQVPFLLLSQLNRLAESRKDNRPMMSDLRDSGDIEAHADFVGLLHRPEYYDRTNMELQGKAELIIGKQRNGDTPTIPLYFRRECGKFESVERAEGQSA